MIGRHVIVACAVVVAAVPVHASAAAQRTFVASTGDDGNACSRAAPCRSFATAILQTNAGGEVVVLDSAGYGPVTITQAVSIVAPPGVYAGISVLAGTSGVTVSAGPTDKVVLRGLSISGQDGVDGIAVSGGGEVHIEKCVVSNMADNGVFVFVATDTRIHIRESVIRSNGGAGLWVAGGTPVVDIADSQFALNGGAGSSGPLPGIVMNSGTLNAQRIGVDSNAQFGVVAAADTGSAVVATLSDSTISGNTNGGAVAASSSVGGGTSSLTFIRSTIARNGGVGVWADGSDPGMQVSLTLSDSAVTENGGPGVEATGATTTVLVTRSTIARNVGPDLLNSAGVMRSSGNNTLSGRGAPDIQGAITPNPLQ